MKDFCANKSFSYLKGINKCPSFDLFILLSVVKRNL